MLFSTLNSSRNELIEQARTNLYWEISKLKEYNIMSDRNDLQAFLSDLTKGDQEQVAAYEEDVRQAKEELDFHQKKIRYLNALISQREGFVKQITAKLEKVKKFGSKIGALLK